MLRKALNLFFAKHYINNYKRTFIHARFHSSDKVCVKYCEQEQAVLDMVSTQRILKLTPISWHNNTYKLQASCYIMILLHNDNVFLINEILYKKYIMRMAKWYRNTKTTYEYRFINTCNLMSLVEPSVNAKSYGKCFKITILMLNKNFLLRCIFFKCPHCHHVFTNSFQCLQ